VGRLNPPICPQNHTWPNWHPSKPPTPPPPPQRPSPPPSTSSRASAASRSAPPASATPTRPRARSCRRGWSCWGWPYRGASTPTITWVAGWGWGGWF